MSKKNKCNGLDCEMCGNAKCPNEEKEKIIDGIDVSESVLTATNNDVYYSQKAVDELQNDIKRLQEENEGLKSLNDFNVQKNEVLQEENEKLKARLKTLDDEVLTIEITPDEFERYKKYEQALGEIRKKITPVCAYCNNIDGFTTWDDCENVCEKGVIKYLKIIDEALNDRD